MTLQRKFAIGMFALLIGGFVAMVARPEVQKPEPIY
jgi:hypothetical protein